MTVIMMVEDLFNKVEMPTKSIAWNREKNDCDNHREKDTRNIIYLSIFISES